jgi:type I restriction enzyme R subunit
LQKFPFVLRGLLHAAGAESAEEATDEEKQQAKAWEAEIAKRRYALCITHNFNVVHQQVM